MFLVVAFPLLSGAWVYAASCDFGEEESIAPELAEVTIDGVVVDDRLPEQLLPGAGATLFSNGGDYVFQTDDGRLDSVVAGEGQPR